MSLPGRMLTQIIPCVRIGGVPLAAANAGTTNPIKVIEYDDSGYIMRAKGTDVPVDSTAGYAKGCKFIDTNVAAGTGGVYENVGSTTACNFDLVGTVGADSVGGANIADDAISAEHLDDGILPSHVVKYAGKITWSGSGASLATTVTGVAATDVVIGSIQTVPTQAAYLVSIAPTTNTITTVLSAANTSNDAVISYTVFRAVA